MSTQRIVVVAAPYHPSARGMISVARRELQSLTHIEVLEWHEVAGCFEIPLRVQFFIKRHEVDAIVTLGAIERGETGHGLAIANAVIPALMTLSLQHEKPVGLGIIGPGATHEQMEARLERVARDAVQAVAHALSFRESK
jgi:6,7-dimethyl-8-ribityllumazine synthase